jgi:hypothetical protein
MPRQQFAGLHPVLESLHGHGGSIGKKSGMMRNRQSRLFDTMRAQLLRAPPNLIQ